MDLANQEVKARDIGSLVMMYLKHLDPVAYVRFASVYINFHDVDEFVNGLKDPDTIFQSPLLPSAQELSNSL